MSADEAWVLLIALVAVWCVLGVALAELLGDTGDIDPESVSRLHTTGSPGRQDSASPVAARKSVASRQPPALPWRRCIRCPKTRRRIRRANLFCRR